MTNISSGVKTISKSDEKVFAFLSDFNNFQNLMPEKVINWQSSSDECSFTVDGMADIGMKIIDKEANNKIVIESSGKNPFTFQLFVFIQKVNEDSCDVELKMEANLNAMLAMMAKRPLENLLKMMLEALDKYEL